MLATRRPVVVAAGRDVVVAAAAAGDISDGVVTRIDLQAEDLLLRKDDLPALLEWR